jgi:hypothetical protein
MKRKINHTEELLHAYRKMLDFIRKADIAYSDETDR